MIYFIQKNKTLIFILFAALSVVSQVYAEDTIRYFDEKLTISLLFNYKNGSFFKDETGYKTNRPLNIGLGFRYKNIAASASIPIPFKDASFDFEINPYFDSIYYHAYLKLYQDFYKDNQHEKSELDILSSAITATYVVNHQNHSLSSVINLDKKQTVSSGSLLYAFGTFFSSIFSEDDTMNNYNERRQNLLYFGPGIGYSYTFVFGNDMFLNISMVIFTNAGINIQSKEWSFIPQLEPQIVFGQHNKTWSFNVKFAYNSEFILKEQSRYDILTLVSLSSVLSKRF
jgi:hypothetical protein